ncbi:MAG: hypothetical protein Q4E53_12155 [Eubacteriales bacterium]|nr:hypothetical protein [Eubacteriales bacterium]
MKIRIVSAIEERSNMKIRIVAVIGELFINKKIANKKLPVACQEFFKERKV